MDKQKQKERFKELHEKEKKDRASVFSAFGGKTDASTGTEQKIPIEPVAKPETKEKPKTKNQQIQQKTIKPQVQSPKDDPFAKLRALRSQETSPSKNKEDPIKKLKAARKRIKT